MKLNIYKYYKERGCACIWNMYIISQKTLYYSCPWDFLRNPNSLPSLFDYKVLII
jgi:hypothetical protein